MSQSGEQNDEFCSKLLIGDVEIFDFLRSLSGSYKVSLKATSQNPLRTLKHIRSRNEFGMTYRELGVGALAHAFRFSVGQVCPTYSIDAPFQVLIPVKFSLMFL